MRVGAPVPALLLIVSTAVTILWSTSMSAAGMPMSGGWTMSMVWMRMPGQSWAGAAASFVGMWTVMMVAMMLPSLLPMLRRFGEAVARTEQSPLRLLTATAAAGYFFVWTLFGLSVFPLGIALATIAMEQPLLSRAVPTAAGVTILIAGAFQFTTWKSRQLACVREERCAETLAPDSATAWRHGIRLGLDCARCCANLMVILLVTGVMDLRVMAAVTAAITLERLSPSDARAARAIGVAVIGAGVCALAGT